MTETTGDSAGLPDDSNDAFNIAAPFGVGADVAAEQTPQQEEHAEDAGDDVLLDDAGKGSLPPVEDAGSPAEELEQRRQET